MIGKPQLQAIMPGVTHDNLERFFEPLNQAMEKYHIDTHQRIACFLAQLAHESNQLSATSENLNYSAEGLLRVFPKYFTPETAKLYARKPEQIANRVYANRGGNGDENSGDGWRYRGRGPIQITLKDNYAILSKDLGVDFVANPELLEGPIYGAMSAGAFWNRNGLNEIADHDDAWRREWHGKSYDRFEWLTQKINGGQNGIEDRKKYYERAKQTLGV